MLPLGVRRPSSVRPSLAFHILIFSSETAGPIGTKLGRKHLCKVLYEVVHFVPIGQQTWPPWAILNSDWLNFQKSSPLKPLGQMEPNLTGSIYGRSCIKFVHFVPIGQQTWPPWAILNSDWPSLQKSSSLKPLGQMEPNLTGSIYGRSFMKFVHFVPIGRQTWPPWAILNSDWLNFQKSSPLKPLGQMEPNLTGSIYGRSCIMFVHFVPIGQQTWPPWAILNSDWPSLQKSSSLKPLGQMEPNLTGSIYGRSFMKFVHFVPIGRQTWPPWAILNSDWPSLQKSSSLKPLGQMEPNLTGSIGLQTWEVLYEVCSFR